MNSKRIPNRQVKKMNNVSYEMQQQHLWEALLRGERVASQQVSESTRKTAETVRGIILWQRSMGEIADKGDPMLEPMWRKLMKHVMNK